MVWPEEALEFGMVLEVVPRIDLMAWARKRALMIATKPPRAVRVAKRLISNAERSCHISRAPAPPIRRRCTRPKTTMKPLPHCLTNVNYSSLAIDGSAAQMSLPNQKKFDQIAQMWNGRGLGLISEMSLKIEKLSAESVLVRMPFNPAFCVDREETLLHGGVLTALLDSVFGLANLVAIEDVSTMATLDLRVDYLRPAKSRADVLVKAQCYRQTRHIAFNTGSVWFDETDRAEVARGAASFALTRGGANVFETTPAEKNPK